MRSFKQIACVGFIAALGGAGSPLAHAGSSDFASREIFGDRQFQQELKFPVCAKSYSELDQTESLQNVKTLLPPETRLGLVNLSKGSYFFVDTRGDEIRLTFFTTALFDLYGVRREGPAKFCDTGKEIRVIGIERDLLFRIENGHMLIDDGGPKRDFVVGEMPEELRRKNEPIDPPSAVATESKPSPNVQRGLSAVPAN